MKSSDGITKKSLETSQTYLKTFGVIKVSLTKSEVTLVVIVLSPAAAQVLQDHGHVTEDDEGWREDRSLVKGHDQLVALELPDLVRYGLHLKECVTEERNDLLLLYIIHTSRPEELQ